MVKGQQAEAQVEAQVEVEVEAQAEAQVEVEAEREAEAVWVELHTAAGLGTQSLTSHQEEDVPEEQKQTEVKDDECLSSPADLTCLTVQPSRVLCGVRLNQEILFLNTNRQ